MLLLARHDKDANHVLHDVWSHFNSNLHQVILQEWRRIDAQIKVEGQCEENTLLWRQADHPRQTILIAHKLRLRSLHLSIVVASVAEALSGACDS